MPDPIGLLALQGDFEMHRQAFAALEVATRLIRRPAELDGCGGLVIPGGESTTMVRLLDRAGLRGPIAEFARSRPLLGTCAGLIVLADELVGESPGKHGVEPLGLLRCGIRRNGYGRQVDSFSEDISIAELDGTVDPFRAVYIRAPRIVSVGAGVEVVALRGDEPVGVRQDTILCFTFHPELTGDGRIHAAFATMVAARRREEPI